MGDYQETYEEYMERKDRYEFDKQEYLLKIQDQRIKQLEDALRNMGESLEFYADTEGGAWAACQENDTAETCCHMVAELSGGERAREALSRNKEILDTINKRGEE